MMTLVFDKNTQNERTLPIDRVYFRATEGIVQGVYDKVLEKASDVPDLSPFNSNPHFTTLEVRDGELIIPVTGVSYIRDVTGNLYDNNYNLTITMAAGE